MLFDDLQTELKSLDTDVQTIISFWKNSNLEPQLEKLTIQSESEEFWQSKDQASVLKELQHIKNQKEQYDHIVVSHQEFSELLDVFKDDEAELENAQKDLKELGRSIRSFKIQLLLSEADDNENCFLHVNAGAGGTEAQDWADMVLRMYIRFCEQNRLQTSIIDYQPADEAGIKSATVFVKGKKAHGLLKSEHGVHRLVRISPFDSNKRRHTSFCSVSLTPEAPEVEIEIDPTDLRIDTYRASGAGGQHVNKTDSAIRITHHPSGIVVQCQNERSQLQNKETAMKILKARLVQKAKEEQAEKVGAIERKKIEWGSQIRSYVLHPYKMVKDHRTNHESSQPDLVLDGQLMDFIESYLVQ